MKFYNACLVELFGRPALGLDLRPLACWDCGFGAHRWHGCLSVVGVVCCQVEVSASGRSLVQRSSIECVCVSECDREESIMRRPWARWEAIAPR